MSDSKPDRPTCLQVQRALALVPVIDLTLSSSVSAAVTDILSRTLAHQDFDTALSLLVQIKKHTRCVPLGLYEQALAVCEEGLKAPVALEDRMQATLRKLQAEIAQQSPSPTPNPNRPVPVTPWVLNPDAERPTVQLPANPTP